MSFSGVSLENREKLHSPLNPFAELVPFCCALLCNSRQHSTKASTWPCRRDSLSGDAIYYMSLNIAISPVEGVSVHRNGPCGVARTTTRDRQS